MRRSYDVVVVGLGGMGSAAAYHLARRGLRVLGLERFGLAHDRGSSHGGPRILRLAYFEDPAYVPLLLRAYELWPRLARDAASDLMLITGGLLLGRAAGPQVAGAVRSAEQWGLVHQILDAAEVRRRVPTLAPGRDTVAFFEPTAGLVDSEATVRAHVRLALAAGAQCRFSEPLLDWAASAGDAGITVRTAAETFHAEHLVICTGAYASTLPADLPIPLTVQRQLHTWFQPEAGIGAFLPDRHPVWLWPNEEDPSGTGFAYGFPAVDGPAGGVKMNVVLGSGPCTPEAVDRPADPEELAVVTAHLRRRLATGPGRLLRAVPCLYENTPDRHFVLGRHPHHRQVVLAAGFSGHGFKFVPVVGEIVSDLVIDGATAHPIALFDPSRFGTGPVP